MNRRHLLQAVAATIPFVPSMGLWGLPATQAMGAARATSRVRPRDSTWPSEASWDELSRNVGGQLLKVQSQLTDCRAAPASARCAQVFTALKNPYYLGDEVGLTQTLGWVDAWTSQPSARICRPGRVNRLDSS